MSQNSFPTTRLRIPVEIQSVAICGLHCWGDEVFVREIANHVAATKPQAGAIPLAPKDRQPAHTTATNSVTVSREPTENRFVSDFVAVMIGLKRVI